MRTAINRPQQLFRRDGRLHVARHENRTPDLSDRLVAIAIHDLTRQRDGLAPDHEAHPRADGRRLERQAAPLRCRSGPIIEPAAIGQRATQKVGLRPLGILSHRQHEAARQQSPRRHGRYAQLQSFGRPTTRRHDGDAVGTDRAVARIPDRELDLQPFPRDHNAVVDGTVDRNAGSRRNGAVQQAALHRIDSAQQARRPEQIRQRGRGTPGIQRGARGIDERRVAGNMDRRVDAREHRRFRPVAPSRRCRLRCEQRNARRRRASPLQLPHVLRAVAAPARHRDLEVRLPDQRIERPDRQGERRGGRIAARRAIKLLWAAGGVAEQIEGLARENRRDLMVTMAVRRGAREHRDDDLRPEAADHVEDVFENRVARPEPKRFVGGLGEAEVVRAGEELARAVELAGGQQLLGADDPQLGTELGADEVLAAFAAREREIRGLCAHAARQQHQQLRVFVVGVRADHEHALVAAELAQGGSQRSDAAGAGRSHLSTRHAGGAEAQQEPDDEGFHYWERYTAPPFITNFTRCSSVISRVGSPATAIMSAYSPGAIAPTFCSWPSSAAATEVPD